MDAKGCFGLLSGIVTVATLAVIAVALLLVA
jgi:hypothetical protein